MLNPQCLLCLVLDYFVFDNYLVSFEGGNVELGEHGEYHVMTTL